MTRRRRILLVTCFAGLVLVASFLTLPRDDSSPPKMVVFFTGYTNLTNTTRSYAVIALTNYDKATLQMRSARVEFEGEENFRAPIFNRNFLPKLPNLLKTGDSQIIILGDPGDPDHPGKMRLSLECARFGLKQKLFSLTPRRRLLSLAPSGEKDRLRLYLWGWGLPFIVNAPHNYSAQSQWLPAPYAPSTVPDPKAKAQL